ncbi:MAG: S-layer domain protein [Parcubacteria group bacterium GW2011_GWA2_36_10]|nr:MAG: S-layer domain protein [Parcubacteria group bacterium GW2011_GWA2_36_10]
MQEKNRGAYAENLWHKKATWLFILVLILVLIGGIWYFNHQLLKPLTVEVPDFIKKDILEGQDQTQTIADLKNKDTDADGLTDYQEIYQYNTSIFLADTDSDNYSDLEEVNSGNDPICPTNQDCNLLALITPKTNLASVVQEVAMNPNLTIEQAAFREFRKFLLDNGMKQEEVDGLTDDDLFYIFSILNEAESGQNVDPQDMSAAEVKAFLLSQSSADKKAIEALSDEELLNIGKKLVNQ